MSEGSSNRPTSVQEARTRLEELAAVLRGAEHLEPEARAALADLIGELSRDLAPTGLPPEELEHLTTHVAHLVDELRNPQPHGVVAVARDRLQRAMIQAEVKAPLAAGLFRRMIDALAALGI